MKSENPIGVVVDNDDPNKAGRVKIQLAHQDGGNYPEWVRPILPAGWFVVPNNGDRVEVVYPEGTGDIDDVEEIRYRGKTVDLATEWPSSLKTSYPKRHGFATKGGIVIFFDDKLKLVSVSTSGGYLLTLDEGNKKVEVKTPSGPELTLDLTTGTATLKGTILLHLNSPLTKLSDTTTDPALLGAKVTGAFTAYGAAMAQLAIDWAGQPNVPIVKNAYFITNFLAHTVTLIATLPTWVSAKVTLG